MTDLDSELRKYLTEWLTWAENGAPPGQPFSRRYGLCSSANRSSLAVRAKLEELLDRDFANDTCPFGRRAYFDDAYNGTQHLNPDRLAWVRKTLGIEPWLEDVA